MHETVKALYDTLPPEKQREAMEESDALIREYKTELSQEAKAQRQEMLKRVENYNHEDFSAILDSIPLDCDKRTEVMELELDADLAEYYRNLYGEDLENQMGRLLEACMIYFLDTNVSSSIRPL